MAENPVPQVQIFWFEVMEPRNTCHPNLRRGCKPATRFPFKRPVEVVGVVEIKKLVAYTLLMDEPKRYESAKYLVRIVGFAIDILLLLYLVSSRTSIRIREFAEASSN